MVPMKRPAWNLSLLLLSLSVLTGILFLLMGTFPGRLPLDPGNVRHAHSHLMFFGWGLLPLLHLVFRSDLKRNLNHFIIITIPVLSLSSYLAFLYSGYKPVSVGGARIPLSIILSSLTMVFWYFPFAIYIKEARKMEHGLLGSRGFLPFTFLVLSTGGAWGLAILKASGMESELFKELLKQTFLTLFVFGWLLPGAIHQHLPPSTGPSIRRNLLAMTAPILLIPTFAPPATVGILGSMVGIAGSVLYPIYLFDLLAKGRGKGNLGETGRWGFRVTILAATTLLLNPLLPRSITGEFRLFFLHLVLAGAASFLILARFTDGEGRMEKRLNRFWGLSFGGVILSRLFFTSYGLSFFTGEIVQSFGIFVAILSFLSVSIRLYYEFFKNLDTP